MPTEPTQARNLYARYKRWAEDAREYVQPERKVNDAMEGHGVASPKTNNKKFYHLLLKEHLENFMGKGERVPEPEEVLD